MQETTAGQASTTGAPPKPPDDAAASWTLSRWLPVFLFAGILALGLATRLYRLSAQSVWIDEFQTIGFINAADLRAYLTIGRFYGPENMPVYYLLLYAWRHVADVESIFGLRCLSVMLSIAGIPVLFGLVRRVYGLQAALLAALFLALSPFHARLGQALRPNPLIELLALVSLYAVIRATQEKKNAWWAAATLINLLLAWTHVFAVFFVAAEGVWALLSGLRNRNRSVLLWALIQGVVILSPLLWLAPSLKHVAGANDDFYMALPPIPQITGDLLADDAVMLVDPFAFQGETWGFLPAQLQRFLVERHAQADSGMILFFAASLAWVLWIAGKNLLKNKRNGGETTLGLLFASVGILPLLMLLVASWMWRPCILPRYSGYCSLALYAIAGGAVSRLPDALLRRVVITAAILLYGYQLSLSLPAATRTNWLGAAHRIQEEQRPEDRVFVKGTYRAWEVYRFNAGVNTIPVLPAYTLQAICDKSARYLEKTSTTTNAKPAVWAVIEPFIFTLPPLERFEAALHDRGLEFQHTLFPGMNGVHLYRIERASTERPASPETGTEIETEVDIPGILDGLGYSDPETPEYARAYRAVQQTVDTEFPQTRFYYTLLAMALLFEGYPELAGKAARRAVELDPSYALGQFVLALVNGEAQQPEAAKQAFQAAVDADTSGYYPLYRELLTACYFQPNQDAARAELLRLDAMGVYLPHFLWTSLGLLPRLQENSENR